MTTVRFKKNNDNDQKVPIKLSIDTLNAILAYTISDSTLITRANLGNIRKLFNMIDTRIYKRDHYLMARIHFIKKSVEARLDGYMENPNLILEYGRSKKYEEVEDEIITDAMNMSLNSNEIRYVSGMVSDKLSYSFLYKYKDKIGDLIGQLQNGEYDSLKKLKNEFKKQLTGLLSEIRRVESVETTESIFSLGEEIFENAVTNTVNKLRSPQNQMRTNIQKLNEMLNGGFMAQRFYLFLGLSGGFKSGTLLNMAYNIRLANKNYKTKDPLKKPAILLITQENSVEETVERLFALSVSDTTKDVMKNYTPKEAIKLLKTKGMLKLTKENNIDIIMIYRAGGSINTADIDAILDDFEEEGYEIVALIHDYIKKLRSVRPASELRLELAYIVTELKAIATARGIPIISASQLNRDAARTIDAAVECNKTDLARMLGTANVGESYGMIEESDFVAIVNRERILSEDLLFLTFKRLKIRYGTDESVDYFNHPFAPNGMRLIQDEGLDCVSRINLSDLIIGVPDDEVASAKGRKNAKKRETVAYDEDTKVSLNNLEDIFKAA